MNIDEFLGPARSEMPAVEATIRKSLESGDRVLREPATHLLNGGGKRLRPALVLLSAFTCKYDPRVVIPAAAAVEMIHMATLIHDDIIDESGTRRGNPTVNSLWGEKTALLAGDYLFARAFLLLAGIAPGVLEPLAAAVNGMCLGQASELRPGSAPDEREYFRRIERKTAAFMAACCRLGSTLGGARPCVISMLSDYGRNLGMAFQVMDDVLDISGDPRQLGKPSANDLRQGIYTLPIIHSLKFSPDSAKLRELLDLVARRHKGHRDQARADEWRVDERRADEGRVDEWHADDGTTDEAVDGIVSILEASGSLHHSRSVAEWFAAEASRRLSGIPPSEARDSLAQLPEFVLRRVY